MALDIARSHINFLIKLLMYFVLAGLLMVAMFGFLPTLAEGGQGWLNDDEFTRTFIEGLLESGAGPPSLDIASTGARLAMLGILSLYFLGTILLMVPITWVYMYTHPDSYNGNLIIALVILPICATATVWLIQDSLPLAFGLAALVAAVRFRIRLDNPLDGGYIFSSISVGLASGVGYVGVGYVMTLFFCFCATALSMLRYGKSPNEENPPGTGARSESRRAASGVAVPQDSPLQ